VAAWLSHFCGGVRDRLVRTPSVPGNSASALRQLMTRDDDVKPCRHCRQPIAADARLCQHCHGFQSWLAGPHDPRFQLVWPAVFVIFMAGLLFFMKRTLEIGDGKAEQPRLEVSDVTQRVVPSSEGQRLYVFGRIRNKSSQDAASIWFRVNAFDDADHVVDGFLAQSSGLIVSGNGSTTFRIYGPLSVAGGDVKRTEVAVERAKARDKWD
jgi:hypothetical protein